MASSLAPPDAWIVADPSDLSTDLTSTWWGTYIDLDTDVFETGDASIVFNPTASVSAWLVSGSVIPISATSVLRAAARFRTDDASISQSLFRLGFAFYDASLSYLGRATLESYGFATANTWTDHTAIARTDLVSSSSRYARLIFGRHSTSGDTNTIWVNSVTSAFEPDFGGLILGNNQTISSTGDILILLDGTSAVDGELNGVDLDVTTGEVVINRGGTYSISGQIDFTTTAGAKVDARIYKKVTSSGGTTNTMVRKGTERHVATGDLTASVEANTIARLNSGDRIGLYLGTSATGTANAADLKMARISG